MKDLTVENDMHLAEGIEEASKGCFIFLLLVGSPIAIMYTIAWLLDWAERF